MKRLFKFLVVPFLLGVAFVYATPKSASAGVWDNAYDYYSTYGSQKKVANKKIYWATRSGSATTKNRYTIEAWRISGDVGYHRDLTQKTQGYSVPSGTAGSRSNADSNNNSFVYHPSSVQSGGYRYDLYYIDLEKMRQEDSDMEALFNRAHANKSEVTLRLDSLTFYSVSSGQWWSGTADRYGNVASLAGINQGYNDNRYGSTLGEAKGMNAGMFSSISFDGWYNQIIHVPYDQIPQKIEPTKPTVDFVSIKDDEEWVTRVDGASWVRPTSADKAPDWTRIYSRGFQDWPYPGYPRGNNRVYSHFLRFLGEDGHSEKIQMTTGNANYRYDYQNEILLNNISPQFRRWTSGTYEHSEAYTWVKFALDNKDYNIDLYVDSENGKYDGYYTKNKIKTDGKAPTVDTIPTIDDGNVDTAVITFHNAGDVRGEGDSTRAGVGMATKDEIDQSIKIYKPGQENNAVYVYVTQRTETYVDEYGVQRYDLKWIINYNDAKFNSLGLKEYYGELKFKIHLEDWLSNTYESGEYSLHRADPTPEGAKVSLNSWHYSAPNDNVKWVNTKDKFQVQTWVWSNPQFSTLPAGYPTETEFMLPDKYADVATVSKNTQSNVTGFGLSSKGLAIKYEETDKAGVTRKGITSQRDLIAKSTAIGKIYTPTSTGATDWMGTKYPLGEEVTEIHGYKVAVDDTKPAGTSVKVGRTESQISVKDSESGLKKVTLVADGETLLDKTYRDLDTINPSQKKVTSDTIIVDTKQHDTGKLTVVDNVGNTTVVDLKDLLTKTTSQIEINDVPIITPPGGSFPNGIDQGIKGWASLNPQGVEKDGRRYLKVEATGGVTKNPVPGFTPIFRLRGSGPEITFTSADIMATGSPKLSVADATKNPIYIDDNYNTPNAPALKYTTNSTEAKIYWDAMEDPLRDYNFIVDSKVSNRENFIKELETTGGVKFASGYDHYNLKVYRVSGNGVKPTAGQKPIIDKETKELEFNLNMWESGWLYVECTMYDFNGNPSGTTRVWFNHDQPTLYTDISVTVTAIKDIDWEKATYPFEYGYGIDAPGEVVEHTHGKDYDKFPLGKNYKFNNKPIAQGYAINYNIIKESREELNDLTIRYKYYGDNGELLTMKSKGELLSTIDNKEGTNYTKQVLSSSELARLNKSTVDRIPVYLKHFAPVDVEAYKPNGELYTGNVTVKVEFVSHVDGKEFTRGLRLYTFTTTETALDDLEGDKQR